MKTEGFMIRINAQKHAELKKLAERLNLKLVDLARLSVDALLDYANENNGEIRLPLKFDRPVIQPNVSSASGDTQLHRPSVSASDASEDGGDQIAG